MDGTELVFAGATVLVGAAGAAFAYLHLRKKEGPSTRVDTRVGPIDASTRIGSVHVDARPPPATAPIPTPNVALPAEKAPKPAPVGTDRPEMKGKAKPRLEQVTAVLCNEAIEVENATYETLDFELDEGDSIKGIAKEKYGREFSVYVYDEDDYAEFARTREPAYALYESEDEKSHAVEFDVPADGIYYVVLDTYGKVNDRTVEIRLRRTRTIVPDLA